MLKDRVREQRERAGWNQAELARQTGLTSGYINQIEAGDRPNPGINTVRALARALGVSMDYLANGVITGPLDRLAAEGIPPYVLAELGPLAQELTDQDWEYLLALARSRAEEYRRQQQAGEEPQQRRRERATYQRSQIEPTHAGAHATYDTTC